MRIKILHAFNDLEAKDDESRRVDAGRTITVTAERGQQLIDLGLAEAAGADGETPNP